MTASNHTAWLFAGQGSQYLGMGRDLWSRPGRALDIVEEAESISGFPLRQISLQGPSEELTRTDVLQPALSALALGCVELLKDAGLTPDMVAGHSLGEFAALSAAGVLSVSDCLRLVTERGRLMQNAALELNGGMAAVKYVALHLLEEIIARACPDIRIANFNSPDQLVVSGANNALVELAQQVTVMGGQVVPLPVAGPWHHPSMSEASLEFQSILDGIEFCAPRCPVYMNVSAVAETDPESIRDLVRVQMTSPVLWQTSVQAMFAAGATLFLEVGPGKVLRGLMRRIIPNESAYRVRGIENARSLQFLSTEALR